MDTKEMSCRRLGHVIVLIWITLLIDPGLSEAAKKGKEPIRRFALVVGVNNGGKDRVKLRYAVTDARSMARVLRQLGGVDYTDLDLLAEPDWNNLVAGINRMKRRLEQARKPGQRLELVFYYSGHSDERGLLLDGRHFTYLKLRHAVRALPADVHIALLDSCASGTLTRTKGGRRRPPFLVDTSSNVRGHAFITSASATEAAQESDRLQGSFFTHHMVAGLRGAADANRDGRVTLNEAYHHAFHETLAQTETSRAGPQHPNYDMDLAGSGDLVLTDLRGTTSLMVLGADIDGRVVIRDVQGQLVAEIRKGRGKPLSLGLEPGPYAVTVESGKDLRRGTVTLGRRRRTLVRLASLDRVEARLAARTRGDQPPEVAPAPPLPEKEYLSVWFSPPFSWIGPRGRIKTHFSLSFLASTYAVLHGVDISLGGTWATEQIRGAQIALGFNGVSLDTRGLQLALGFDWTGQDLRGVQLALGFNGVGRDLLGGVQVALGFNVVRRDMLGAQVALGFNTVSGDMDGTQVALGFNTTQGLVDGTQIALGLNLAGDMVDGVQVGLGLNLAPEVRGAQWSSGVNIARQIGGAQVGIVNVGGAVNGAQVGIVNVGGSVSHTQVGVLNIARKSDHPVGLLNLVWDGLHDLEIWSSDAAPANIGFKLGGRRFYSLTTAGIQPGTEPLRWLVGVGLGVRFYPGRRIYLDTDLSHMHINEGKSWSTTLNTLNSWRLTVGWRLHEHFAIFGGLSFNVLVSRVNDGSDFGLFSGWKVHEGTTNVRVWPGLLAGISF